MVCFSLSGLFHLVWQTLSPFTSLQMTQVLSFLWQSNISFFLSLNLPFIFQVSLLYGIIFNILKLILSSIVFNIMLISPHSTIYIKVTRPKQLNWKTQSPLSLWLQFSETYWIVHLKSVHPRYNANNFNAT